MTDHFAWDDLHAVHLAKNIVANLNHHKKLEISTELVEVQICLFDNF